MPTSKFTVVFLFIPIVDVLMPFFCLYIPFSNLGQLLHLWMNLRRLFARVFFKFVAFVRHREVID